MIKFETGKTYSTRSIGDSNCIIRATVIRRTAKMVLVQLEGEKAPKSFYVKPNWDNSAEMFKPWGAGSMCPVMTAKDTAALLPDWAKSQNPAAVQAHAATVAANPEAALHCRGLGAPSLVLLQGGRA